MENLGKDLNDEVQVPDEDTNSMMNALEETYVSTPAEATETNNQPKVEDKITSKIEDTPPTPVETEKQSPSSEDTTEVTQTEEQNKQEATIADEEDIAWAEVAAKLQEVRQRYCKVREDEGKALSQYSDFVRKYGAERAEIKEVWAEKVDAYRQERTAVRELLRTRAEKKEIDRQRAERLEKAKQQAAAAELKLKEAAARAREEMLKARKANETSIKEVQFADTAASKPTHGPDGRVYKCSMCNRRAECPAREYYMANYMERNFAAKKEDGRSTD
ncbi:hypothetical protein TKK_0010174 [Trichogramma kaykai]